MKALHKIIARKCGRGSAAFAVQEDMSQRAFFEKGALVEMSRGMSERCGLAAVPVAFARFFASFRSPAVFAGDG